MRYNIAIDGPSASGKSTIAKAIAQKYSLIHIDTGAMYRCIAYYAKQFDLDIDNPVVMEQAVKSSSIEFDNNGKIYLNAQDVSDLIRTEEISWMASTLSKHLGVRQKMVELQQEIAKDKGFILDGRDIGTVVLPDAEVKIFLTASAEARAKRRYLEYINKGEDVSYESVYGDIIKRDKQDMSRANSPLKKADDAVEIDSSEMTISDVLETVRCFIEQKIG